MALQASVFPSSSSSSSSFSYEWPYHVFLSFRGCDTRHGFTGNLYKALSDKGIRTFFDDRELQGGEEITPALVNAIQDSRIAIVVFSVNYASSSFCLHELATIMECVKGMGRLVLPVFYDVDPCDVRHQRGSFGGAMNKHEERFKDDKEKVQKWREALRQAAAKSGEHFKLGNEYEYVCIEKIIKVISKKISRVPLHIADRPVGLKSQVLAVNSLLNDGFDCGVHMVGIYGIGGIGKTTLAQAVYNFTADQFEGSCFLENVREKSIKFGLEHLQETLLSEMLQDKDINLGSVNQGIPIIKQRLRQKKVLLVLDDVDELKQLRAIVGGVDWLGSGSRVIITTRDKHLLASHGIERQYEVNGLSEKEALMLLGWNAFKDENSDPSYEDILKRAVTYACGLPLALQAIGSNLFGKSIEEWSCALDQYERIPDKEIQKILKISYDALENWQQKIFLDIACCSNGYNWVEVQDILHARHDVSRKYGISVLVQKSLLMSDKYGFLTIHDLIQDMGREIIRQESPKHPDNRSRVWIPKDVVQVLQDNTGTGEIEIMILDASVFEKIDVKWDGETFKTMRNLEILVIRNTHFSQGAKYLPNSLRVLEWWNYPSNLLPSNFYPKKLAIFKLPGSSSLMSVGFIEKQKFMNLKDLELDGSNIKYIPDVSGVPNLETLSFQYCRNLIKVHESVGFLDKLSQLGVSGCSKLRSFPALMLPSLEELDFSRCSSLENFPEILGHMEVLEKVNLNSTSIKELPYSFSNLRNLGYLDMGFVGGLLQLSSSISMLHGLTVQVCGELKFVVQDEDEGLGSSMVSSNAESVYIEIACCNISDESVANVLASFCNVTDLDLSGTNFTILPETIKELCGLTRVNLDGCKELKVIRGIPPNIEWFSAANCMSLTSSSRSMFLNEELHNGGYREFHLPGSSIPKWFEHQIGSNSFSFWFRNKLPLVSVCVVTGPVVGAYDFFPCVKLIINGNEEDKCYFSYTDEYSDGGITREGDHINIFYGKMILFKHAEGEWISKNEWNHVQCRVNYSERLPPFIKKIGIHVLKHESNMEDIRFTDPLLLKTEVNMGDFHRNMEQQKNLASLALLETQQEKWLSLHLPPTTNSLNDNMKGDLNSIPLMQTSSFTSVQDSAGLSKDKGKDLVAYDYSSDSMHSCGQQLDKNWESNSMKLASTSDTIREGSSCHDNLCTSRLDLDYDAMELFCHTPSEVDCGGCGEQSRKTKRSALMLDSNTEPISEVESDLDLVMARLASDTNSEGAKDPTNITEVAPDRSRAEEWSKRDEEEKRKPKGKSPKRKASTTHSSEDKPAKVAKASNPSPGANALPIQPPSVKSPFAVIANDSPSVNPADKGSAQEISSATTSTSHSSKDTQNVEKPQGVLLQTALAQVQQIAPCPISQLETEPSRPHVQDVLASTPAIVDAAIPQQLENLAASPPTNTIFEKGGFSFDEPSAEVIKEKTIDLGSLDLTEEDLDFGDLVRYLDPEHKTTEAVESEGVKSREGPPPIQTAVRELLSRVLSLLNHPLEELTSDEVLKQKMVEVVSTLGEVTAPSVVQPICSSLQYFVESSLEKIPNANSLKTQLQETSSSLSKLKASAQPLKKAKETASDALSRGENKLSELTSQIRALAASRRALEEQMGTSRVKFEKIENKLLFVEEQIREKELAIEGMKKAIEEGEAAKASLLEEQEALKLKLRTLLN